MAIFSKEAAVSAISQPAQANAWSHVECAELFESGRWVAAAVPLGSGARCAYVHSFYAPTNPHRDPFRKAFAQRLLTLLFGAAAAAGDAPTIISADLNQNPEQSDIIKAAVASGRWIDVGAAFARGGPIQTTFRREGPYEGMSKDDKSTRIDILLCSVAAWAAIKTFEYRFDLEVPSHIGLRAVFNIPAFASKASYVVIPTPLNIGEPLEDQDNEDLWEEIIPRESITGVLEFIQAGKTSEAFEMASDLGVDFLKACALRQDQ